jgi:aldehyde:ferredoxin oxidoreductase
MIMTAQMYTGGYAGTILSINLSNNIIEKIPLDMETARKYIGGQGLTAKLTYDSIAPRTVDPLSPENVVIFGAGPLVGTMAPTGSRATVMSKSPLSGLIGISNAGHFGTMMKFAGYDQLIIKGRAEKPVYIRITDGDVQIVTAEHIWGRDIPETVDMIRGETGDDYWVSAIGPAGENLVKFATIVNNKHSVFGRTGLGAVMGSKNLKAIAFLGRGSIRVAKPGKFMKHVDRTLKRMQAYSDAIEQTRRLGTQVQALLSQQYNLVRLPRLTDIETFDADKYLDSFRVSPIACSACPIGCKAWMENKNGTRLGASCTYGTVTGPYGVGLALRTYGDTAKVADLGQRLGLDSMVTASLISFAIELYEAGIISREDTDGLDLKWGDTDMTLSLIKKIAHKEGFGSVLAQGMSEAAHRIGGDSARYVSQVKGLTMQPEMFPDIRAVVSPEIFGCFVNPRGWHIDTYRRPALYLAGDKALRVIEEWGPKMGITEEAMMRVVTDNRYNIALFAKYVEEYNLVVQCLGTCDRHLVCLSMDIDMLNDLYSAATGLDTSPSELLQAGERALNIEKAFNIREGASREDDQIPERLLRESLETRSGIYPPANSHEFNTLLDEYYECHGWEGKTGVPTKKKLDELGLESVARELHTPIATQ